MKTTTLLPALLLALAPLTVGAQTEARMVAPAQIKATATNYINNRAPLPANPFVKLPPAAITPRGWVGRMLALQNDGLAGHLGEISSWLDKKGNAWLESGGDHGWEEVPYWLRGYSNMAYISGDKRMLDETKVWVEAIIKSAQPDGFFGPVNIDKKSGNRELWAQMLALQVLQDYYEYSGDERVLKVMTGYFHWQLKFPKEQFLRHFWEKSRGGDNLLSVLWLYNRTGDSELLQLAEKIHSCTANWMQDSNLPNWHNVNIAECFREPATYFLVSKDSAALRATYNDYRLVRRTFGQVPGGMFGSDENCRLGYTDPRQGTETCGFVEQMLSDEILMAQTGDMLWAENLEDVAFNSLPAAFTPDMRALRYLTAPNIVQADANNHAPGVQNKGPFLCMNPFSSRCCQHNHAMGWPYYAENLVLASADGGAALFTYSDCEARLKVADGKSVTFDVQTRYPFSEDVSLTVGGLKKKETVSFPLYLRIPTWTRGAHVTVNGETVPCRVESGLLRVSRAWTNGDRVQLHFPMSLSTRQWQLNKNSVSVDYGPLTLSLYIKERYVDKASDKTAIHDSKWQEGADPSKWPTQDIYADSPWNYAISPCIKGMSVEMGQWPEDGNPFFSETTPLRVKARGARVPSWTMDKTGLCNVLPEPCEPRLAPEDITLIPMGAARLRISAFPPLDGSK